MNTRSKTKAELEDILETGKYPSIKEYLDDGFKTLEYESLEAAQRGRNAVLKDAHNMKAGNRVAEFAAVRLHRNWRYKVTGTHSYDRTLDRKLQGILGKITGEKAYEKMDDLLSGRAQEKANAKRAGKQEKRNQLIQKLKDDLAQILDLDNHPNLKEYLYRSIDLELQKREAENLKRLKEWCDSQITVAKGIRDKGKIEEWEERAKERLPKKNDVQEAEPTEDVETRARKALDEIGITQKVEGCHVTDGYPGVEKVSFRIVLNKGASLAANVRDVIDKIANYFKAKVTHEKNPEVSYGGGVAFVSTFTERDLQAARRALEICFSDDFDKSGENSTTDETEQQNPNARYDIEGDKATINTDTSNVVDEKDLTPAQKLLVSFGKKLGMKVEFVDNPDENFRGVHRKGVTYLNVNGNKELGGVFWHESLHWLRNNNPELYKALVKAAGITTARRQAYLEETGRTDIRTPDEINEEILCDMMDDVAKRTGLFQSIAGKNRGLIERVIQWFKDTLNKFIDHFRNPQGKLTTAQAQALASEFGRIADKLKDPNGNQIFRYNRRTHNVELADGREWSDAAIEEMTAKGASAHHPDKYSFAGVIELPEGYRTESGKSLTESDAREFIVDEKGNRDMGAISKEIEQKTNGIVKAVPVRLQVGVPDINEKDGFGYMHIMEHINDIKAKGFDDIPNYIKHILKNFNQIYQSTRDNNRIILYCKGDKSKGFMPLDLVLVKEKGDYYKVITAFPRRRANKNETLLFDEHPTNSSTAAATVPHTLSNNNKSGVVPTRDNGKSNVSNETISQDDREDKPSFFSRAWNKFAKAVGLDGDRIVTEEDRRREHRQAQEKAMAAYLKEPTKDNMHALKQLGVTKRQLDAYMNGEEYSTEIGLIQNYRGSPSRIAEKNAVFRAFFNMGDRAMDKLIKLRDSFANHYGEAMALVNTFDAAIVYTDTSDKDDVILLTDIAKARTGAATSSVLAV